MNMEGLAIISISDTTTASFVAFYTEANLVIFLLLELGAVSRKLCITDDDAIRKGTHTEGLDWDYGVHGCFCYRGRSQQGNPCPKLGFVSVGHWQDGACYKLAVVTSFHAFQLPGILNGERKTQTERFNLGQSLQAPPPADLRLILKADSKDRLGGGGIMKQKMNPT
jgi:hypothetical protein